MELIANKIDQCVEQRDFIKTVKHTQTNSNISLTASEPIFFYQI